MRLHIKLSRNREIIGFGYQLLLTGCVHKWIGKMNSQHGKISLYSFSWLRNVKVEKDGINLTRDSNLFFSFYNDNLTKEVIKGILEHPEMFFGVKVRDVLIQQTPVFSEKQKFYTSSPILIKRKLSDGHEKHFTFDDEESNSLMTETLQTKLREAGLNDSDIKVYFDKDYPNPKTKVISYGEIKNKVNLCPIYIEGTPEQVAFAWEVGIGNSTGIGFGSIEK